MGVVVYSRTVLVPYEPEQVINALTNFNSVLAKFPHINVVEERPNGVLVKINYRRGFSRLKDKLFLTIKKGESNVLGIAGVGDRIELSLTIRAEKGFPNTTILIDGIIKTDKESLGRKLLEDLTKHIESYIKKLVSGEIEKVKEEKKEYAQPVFVGGLGIFGLTPRSKEEKKKEKPSTPTSVPSKTEEKPATRPTKEVKPEPLVADKIMEISQKMGDPVFMAELIINSRFLQRRRIEIPEDPKLLKDFLVDVISSVRHEGKITLISVKGGGLEGYILVDPASRKIVGAYIEVPGEGEFLAYNALTKISEKLGGDSVEIRIWSVEKLEI